MVPQFAAGRAWDCKGELALPGLRDPRLDARCARPRACRNRRATALSPKKIIKKYGADLLRLWAASVDFTEDVRLSDTILTRLSEAYRKLRNTFRYTLGNLHDFDPDDDAVPADEMDEIDRWILVKAEDLVRKCRVWYDEIVVPFGVSRNVRFRRTDLSAIYFDILKDRLYTTAPAIPGPASAQTAIYRLHLALVRLLAPILTFTAKRFGDTPRLRLDSPASIHLDYFPVPGGIDGGPAEASPHGLKLG